MIKISSILQAVQKESNDFINKNDFNKYSDLKIPKERGVYIVKENNNPFFLGCQFIVYLFLIHNNKNEYSHCLISFLGYS